MTAYVITTQAASIVLISSDANAESSNFVIENATLISYTGDGENISIPNSVTSIGDFVFVSNGAITVS